MKPLPIDAVLPSITDALASASAVVLRAPTGAGKTTRVPPALVDAGIGDGKRLVMLEPRRIAARAAARRIAVERGWHVGKEIGYQVRFDRRAGRETRILIVTEGILIGMLQRDPFLEDIGAVVFDEFHERNLQSDLALAMVRRVQAEAREDLKIAVMSATLEPRPIADYLGDCPIVESRGRLHPVEILYLDRADDRRPDERRPEAVVAAGVRRALDAMDGDVLAFLPGVGEIRRTAELLESAARDRGLRLLSLYGDLPAEQQDAVLAPGSRRKVVLATNVAETSITIEGISAVVDSGLARELRFDPAHGLDRLGLVRISRAAADQRAGRAGRQGPGLCLRLWTEHDDRSLAPATTPEIRRVDLTAPALQLLAWGESDLAGFGWFEPPDPAALERALELLADLGAIDASRSITRLGRAMARLPVHPRLGRLLIAGHEGSELERAALCAALLSERDVVHRGAFHRGDQRFGARTVGTSDLLDRLDALESFVATGYGETAIGEIHRGRARHISRVGRQLATIARRALPKLGDASPQDTEELLLRSLLAAYPDRVARRRAAGQPRGVMVGGRGVRLSEASCVQEAALFVCLDLDSRGTEALVRQASAVEASWLPNDQIETSTAAAFDSERERVVGLWRKRYRDLVLEERDRDPRECDGGAEEVERILVDAARERLDRALRLDEPGVAAFLARARSVVHWRPDLGLPAFTAEDLASSLPHLAAGKRSFDELRRAPLLEILQGSIGFEQLQTLKRMAPERVAVPSGSQIRLRYEPGKPPILAVRIQEMFGQRQTPTVAGGRVPVLLHLLAPNMRPQQVTDDLASFWHNTYPEIRKELRARYPRHAWPEDPLTARPEKRPGRRRKA
ncbi:MAG: ATP-dependent helicase HrpB [bacterium]|nr:ATP-dependent helicase HrpB [bacterium]